MVNLNVRGLLKAAVVVAGTVTFAGAASAAGVDGAVCDPIPEATQGLWPKSKATQVVREVFEKMDEHTNKNGVLDAGAFKTEVEAKFGGVNDWNLSYLPQEVRAVATERHDEAHRVVGGGKLLTDDNTPKAGLEKMASNLAEKDFPSLSYKNTVVSGFATGSWTAVMTGLGQVYNAEVSAVNTALEGVFVCRAEQNAKLAPNP